MDREEFWQHVLLTVVKSQNLKLQECTRFADEAVAAFDERFGTPNPTISQHPQSTPLQHRNGRRMKIRYRFAGEDDWQEATGETLESALKSIAEWWTIIDDAREVEVEEHGVWRIGGETQIVYHAEQATAAV